MNLKKQAVQMVRASHNSATFSAILQDTVAQAASIAADHRTFQCPNVSQLTLDDLPSSPLVSPQNSSYSVLLSQSQVATREKNPDGTLSLTLSEPNSISRTTNTSTLQNTNNTSVSSSPPPPFLSGSVSAQGRVSSNLPPSPRRQDAAGLAALNQDKEEWTASGGTAPTTGPSTTTLALDKPEEPTPQKPPAKSTPAEPWATAMALRQQKADGNWAALLRREQQYENDQQRIKQMKETNLAHRNKLAAQRMAVGHFMRQQNAIQKQMMDQQVAQLRNADQSNKRMQVVQHRFTTAHNKNTMRKMMEEDMQRRKLWLSYSHMHTESILGLRKAQEEEELRAKIQSSRESKRQRQENWNSFSPYSTPTPKRLDYGSTEGSPTPIMLGPAPQTARTPMEMKPSYDWAFPDGSLETTPKQKAAGKHKKAAPHKPRGSPQSGNRSLKKK
eukprot:TRINITY_DN52758_c0_g2_i1.p1 TRINITY_DN52758_c0_g2~~TRINITY_DN52758_c0_g2_i1.p1  ORF type:complete len:504 (-),score=50.15 TRINITY_DN52758_c0_g2_i1:1410-2741(-)